MVHVNITDIADASIMRLAAQIQARLALEHPNLGASAGVLGERVAKDLSTSLPALVSRPVLHRQAPVATNSRTPLTVLEPLTFRHWYGAMTIEVQRTLADLAEANTLASQGHQVRLAEDRASRALQEALLRRISADMRSRRPRLPMRLRRRRDRASADLSAEDGNDRRRRRTKAAELVLHRVGTGLVESRRSEVSKLRSRMDVALAQHRKRYARVLHRLRHLGSMFWLDAADGVLKDWCATPQVEFHPALDSDDKRLIGMWSPPPGEDPEEWDKRVYSARRAEKSALMYYRQFQSDVRDVAIHQLSKNAEDWRSHDIAANGRPIDVKNVRGGAFGGYVVPDEPKRTRAGETVAICGVVSEDEGDKKQTVIGESTGDGLRDVQSIVEEIARTLDLPLEWKEMTRWRAGLGAWLMEFAPEHYDGRDHRALIRLIQRAGQLTDWLGPVPAWARGLEAFWGSPSIGNEGDLGETVVSALAGWGRSGRASRPALFMCVLLFLLAEVKHGRWQSRETREEILNVLFCRTGGRSEGNTEVYRHPLGLHDPLGTIHAVVVALDKLAEKNKGILEEVEALQLRGVGVLRGRRPRKRWFTLLAYCGGCGKSPIWAGNLRKLWDGQDDDGHRRRRLSLPHADGPGDGCGLCPKCLYLVCDDCGFCKEDCSSSQAYENVR